MSRDNQFKTLLRMLFVSLLAILPLCAIAQSSWEKTLTAYGVRVAPVRFHYRNPQSGGTSQVKIILKLENVSSGDEQSDVYLAVAFDEGGTIAADLTDGSGASFLACPICRWVDGLPKGNGSRDWLRLRAGGSVPVAYTFVPASLSDNVRPPFSISASIRVVNPSIDKGKTQTIFFYFDSLE